ncbi:PQQ-dependent sugar dehydrogenase [Tengunoibacter tsumagoiensis]|uniref:L-sorbosone dehydrogenase n=1 Tax=Tengunoibacter tsumagoiensis TaxID=2014871 RepID=A0A401ZTM8_9CHLR|nr:PQQ-dependent sugar dehydrogenase [Tengunoibacter tsumagoiensis]GCE10217.1 L-sorbosone dehydrogenase [Tengunoibacter tsumagoiensis]
MEKVQGQPKKSGQRRWWLILSSIVLVLAIAGAILYKQWPAISYKVTGAQVPVNAAGTTLLQLPKGFQAEVFASGLTSPRMLTIGPDGTLFAAERGTGSILAFPASQHAGSPGEKVVVASGLNDPTSLSFNDGELYVGEASQVSRLTLDQHYHMTNKQVIVSNLPTGGNHVTRTVLVGPDKMLYVSIGSTCNVCIETNEQRATVWQYNLDGTGGHLYAKGLRNAVGLATNPWKQQVWATNNGRDLLGDNIPPETVYALQSGGDYGWPRCHAGELIDPDYGHAGDCTGIIKPVVKMQAHSAPLGLAFYTAKQFPNSYQGMFIAFHGSWNRSVPTGYKVVFVPLNAQGEVSGQVQDFATGWLDSKMAQHGRPVGLAVGPDGSLYVSDDGAGIIYRISYHG